MDFNIFETMISKRFVRLSLCQRRIVRFDLVTAASSWIYNLGINMLVVESLCNPGIGVNLEFFSQKKLPNNCPNEPKIRVGNPESAQYLGQFWNPDPESVF